MQISKATLATLRTQMTEALAGIAKENGIILRVGNCSFTAESATFKLELIAPKNADDLRVSPTILKARADWAMYMFNMKGADPADIQRDDLGKTYGPYKIEGYLPKSHKYEFLCTKEGKLLKVPRETLEAHKLRTIAAVQGTPRRTIAG